MNADVVETIAPFGRMWLPVCGASPFGSNTPTKWRSSYHRTHRPPSFDCWTSLRFPQSCIVSPTRTREISQELAAMDLEAILHAATGGITSGVVQLKPDLSVFPGFGVLTAALPQ